MANIFSQQFFEIVILSCVVMSAYLALFQLDFTSNVTKRVIPILGCNHHLQYKLGHYPLREVAQEWVPNSAAVIASWTAAGTFGHLHVIGDVLQPSGGSWIMDLRLEESL